MIRVIGDVILDRWIVGSVNRISPEAPVPVLHERENYYTLGGAANVAQNLVNMDVDVTLHGSKALTDSHSVVLDSLLKDIKTDMSYRTKTTTKTRLVTDEGHHLLRWDDEYRENVRINLDQIGKDDIILISDYNKGDISNDIVETLSKSHIVFVDPIRGPDVYRDAFLIKPNMKELLSWVSSFTVDTVTDLMQTYNWKWLVVTDGKNGLHVFEKGTPRHDHFTNECKVVADVTGAGDVVISTIVSEFSKGRSIPDACMIANKVATECVQKKGTSLFSKKVSNLK